VPQLTPALTIGPLLLHLLLGCCWHHEHFWRDCHQQAQPALSCGAHECCGEECGDERPAWEAPERHRCDGPTCCFLASRTDSLRVLGTTLLRPMPAPTGLEAESSGLGAARASPIETARPSCPLRIHLLQQVLLI